MCRKLLLLISVCSVLSLSANVFAVNVWWYGDQNDGDWFNKDNYSNDAVPDSVTGVNWSLSGLTYLPIDISSGDAVCTSLWSYNESNTHTKMYMSGGTLTGGVYPAYILMGTGSATGNSTFYLQNGTVTFARVIVGHHVSTGNGTGTLVELYGGTINVNLSTDSGLTMEAGDQYDLIDIRNDGTIRWPGDHTATGDNKVPALINANNIIAYGGQGRVVVDYGVSNPGETTIRAVNDRTIAWAPCPTDKSQYFGAEVVLKWAPGDFAVSHDVYIGTNFNDVNNACRLAADVDGSGRVDASDMAILTGQWLSDPQGPEPIAELTGDNNVNFKDFATAGGQWMMYADSVFKGNQDANSYGPIVLEKGKTYYWRIDEINYSDGNSPWTGQVWSFVAGSEIATNPYPSNGVICVDPNVKLSWRPGNFAERHDVFCGTDFNDVNDADNSWPIGSSVYKGSQEPNCYDPCGFKPGTTYYWRIDEVNDSNSKSPWKGDIWSFTTNYDWTYDSGILVGTYYYPWFASTNLEQGTLRSSLLPKHEPALGCYYSADANTVSSHIDYSCQANIHFWVIEWSGVDSPMNNVLKNYILKNKKSGKLKYAVYYAGQLGSYADPSYSNLWPDFEYFAANYFCDKNYFKIDGKPVVFIYETRAYFNPSHGWAELAALRAAYPDLYLVADEVENADATPRQLDKWDAITGYNAYSISFSVVGAIRTALDRMELIYDDFKRTANSVNVGFIPNATPGFNKRVKTDDAFESTPRYFKDDTEPVEGDIFNDMLREVSVQKIDPLAENMLMVTSFNEWHEDSQIEPTKGTAEPNVTNIDISPSGSGYTNGDYYTDYGQLYLDILNNETSGKAFGPIPGNKQKGVDLDVELSWSSEADANSYDVYFGTDPNPGLAEHKGNFNEPNYQPENLITDTTYYWRVDQCDVNGAALGGPGNIWQFKTVVDPNLIMWLKFDETAGIVAEDYACNINGLLNNFTEPDCWVGAKIDNGLSFDGVDDWLDISDSALNNFHNRTICLWSKRHGSLDETEYIFSTAFWDYKIYIRVLANGNLEAVLVDDNNSFGETAMTENVWYHIALVLRDTDDGKCNGQFYVNGVFKGQILGQNRHTGALLWKACLGSYHAGNGVCFEGAVDDLRIYNYALEVSEVNDIYQQGL